MKPTSTSSMSSPLPISNPLLIDYKEGSYQLAESPILSPILEPCDSCSGSSSGLLGCKECRFTGKNLYHLNSGDIAFLGNGPKGKISISVEIKRFDDLLSSLSTKRLQFQLKKMIQDYPSIYSRWLLIYGRKRRNPKPGPTHGLYQMFNEEKHYWQDTFYGNDPKYAEFSNPKNLNRFLCSPSFTSFFHLQWEETKEDALHWIYDLYKVWQKKWTSHRSMKDDQMDVENIDSFGPDSDCESLGITLSLPNPRLEQNIRFARSIPGIKHDRAKAIAERFWDMEEMSKASIEDLSDIGVKTSDGKRVIKLGKNGLRV